ncbi:hypothetical protein ACSFA0_24665 [Variovorax sp. LT1P1]|uniref:hypothetical protein n=1 Tax=Variovorax sp. LT1P1 TaxID=3443730 RepID=UPI003F482A47
MISAPLADLDELVLKCRDEKAKSYVAEAVASYRVGAYRAAIVGTWIAVCFDIIDKLRELSFSGDKEAEQQIAALERIRASGDVTNALKFEKELLVLARDKFELISHLEHIDLERLQADRNRCAHPSLISEDQVYSPSAELVRAHIHAAIIHLLQHPPAQGKYALDRLKKDIQSSLFPIEQEKMVKVFSVGPLRKPRESLVRNFSLVLLKNVLVRSAEEVIPIYTASRALSAVRTLHPIAVNKLLNERLSRLVRDVDDEQLDRFVKILEALPDTWQMLETDVRERLTLFVQRLPVDSFIDLDFLLEYPPLSAFALHRVKYASRKDIAAAQFFISPPQVIDRAIELYVESNSFESANAGAKLLAEMAYEMKAHHIKRILAEASQNAEITSSFGFSTLLEKLRGRAVPDAEFDELLQKHGLEQHLPGGSDFDIPF